MRKVEETSAFYSSKPIGTAHKSTHFSIPQQKSSPPPGFYSNQAQTQTHNFYQPLQAAKFKQMMEQQGQVEYLLQKGRRDGGGDRAFRLSMSTWPTLQQCHQQQLQTNSGITGFSRRNQAKKGTSMSRCFYAQMIWSYPTETRKRPGPV